MKFKTSSYLIFSIPALIFLSLFGLGVYGSSGGFHENDTLTIGGDPVTLNIAAVSPENLVISFPDAENRLSIDNPEVLIVVNPLAGGVSVSIPKEGEKMIDAKLLSNTLTLSINSGKIKIDKNKRRMYNTLMLSDTIVITLPAMPRELAFSNKNRTDFYFDGAGIETDRIMFSTDNAASLHVWNLFCSQLTATNNSGEDFLLDIIDGNIQYVRLEASHNSEFTINENYAEGLEKLEITEIPEFRLSETNYNEYVTLDLRYSKVKQFSSDLRQELRLYTTGNLTAGVN